MADPAVNRRGIVATLAASALWTCNDACGKLATETFPTGEIMAVRSLFAIALSIGVVVATGHGQALIRGARLFLSPLPLTRALLDAAVIITFYKALPHIPLADITAIGQTTPIIMTILAAALGLERVGWRRFLAVVAGFSGVLLIAKPSGDGLLLYIILAVLSAALVAVRDLLTRWLDPGIPSPIIALMTAVAGGLTGLGLGITEEWSSVIVAPTLYLIVAGLFVSMANLAIVIACRDADLGVIAPFRYFSIVIALALGFVVFRNLPDLVSIIGIVLIMGSGIYTIHREQVRRRLDAAKARPATPGEPPTDPKGSARAAWTGH
jgi:drug/metabolite transporter (DMT)-like permease